MGSKGEKGVHGRIRLRNKAWRLLWAGKMLIADQCGLLVLIRLPLGWGGTWPPSRIGDTTRFFALVSFSHWSMGLQQKFLSHSLIGYIFLAIFWQFFNHSRVCVWCTVCDGCLDPSSTVHRTVLYVCVTGVWLKDAVPFDCASLLYW